MVNIIEVAYKWNGELKNRTSTEHIIVHHAESSNCTVQDIHSWHQERKWLGIGYNFLVRKNGEIYRGRPEWASDSDAFGYNDNSLSICFEGNFNIETMPNEQVNAGIALIQYLLKTYPKCKVLRHKDVNPTECPGIHFPMAEILTRVAKGVEKMTVQEAMKVLVDKGVISSPDYWVKAVDTVKNLDQLIINMAQKLA